VAFVTAKILGIPKATLENWVRFISNGQLKGAGEKSVSPEQMELARLRAELARVKMERDIQKRATACFARESLVGNDHELHFGIPLAQTTVVANLDPPIICRQFAGVVARWFRSHWGVLQRCTLSGAEAALGFT
jgi:hypothetical protein